MTTITVFCVSCIIFGGILAVAGIPASYGVIGALLVIAVVKP